jgi:hypothetical protein
MPADQRDKRTTIELDETTDAEEQKSVRCRECNHELTTPAFAVEPHEHTFRNPAGYSFHLLCYSDAPGASEAGEPTTEACWFAGYSWTYALCGQCHGHVGWWYSGSRRFAGLIATRLIR